MSTHTDSGLSQNGGEASGPGNGYLVAPDTDTGEVLLTVFNAGHAQQVRLDGGAIADLQQQIAQAQAIAQAQGDGPEAIPLVMSVPRRFLDHLSRINPVGNDPIRMAVTALEDYLERFMQVASPDFCFEHHRQGCGDRRGRHVDYSL